MATALLVVSAISAVAGVVQQRRASKEQRRQNIAQNRVAAISRSRRVRQAIAQQRVETARLQSTGFQLGVAGGTAVAGSVAGVASDTSSAVQASNIQFTSQQALAASQNRVSGLQSSGATFGALSSLTGAIGGNEQAVAGIENFFGVGG